ncbi:I78 family peptidase inhibitor [Streptomyces sp. NPDC090109]|uniref:I78 family peptidase inhibitor n=1 Tax=Streptomyces TaxID=1883 RepID=UPI000EF7C33C|nr:MULTISPECIES: I78 family peptidase inhibitor [unclassified Streptomyces]MZE56654.1 proteinase inhibitor I78 [Streptomyces sp. SID5770]
MAPTSRTPEPPRDAPESYVGLGAEGAEQLARTRGWSVVRTLPPGSIITMEYLSGRINFEVQDGTVTRCWLG